MKYLLTLLLVLLPWRVVIAGSVERVPTGDGNYSQLNLTEGSDHYALVDDDSCNSATSACWAGIDDQRDTYTFPVTGGDAVPADSTVDSVVVTMCVDHSGPVFAKDSVRATVRISTTDYDGDRLVVAGSPAEQTYTWAENPATSSAWTTSNANDASIEFGLICVEASDDTYLLTYKTTWYYSAGSPPAATSDAQVIVIR